MTDPHITDAEFQEARFSILLEQSDLINMKLSIIIDRLDDLVPDHDILSAFERKGDQMGFEW